MLSTVHGKSFVTDSWTGEAFESHIKFKIPTRGGIWKGTYATPSTALAALEDSYLGLSPPATADEIQELRGLLQSSIVKTDPQNIYPTLEIKNAPHFGCLVNFGGDKSLDAYHMIYDHTTQREIFSQRLPGPSVSAPTSGGASTPSKASDAAGHSNGGVMMWHTKMVMTTKKGAVDKEKVTTQSVPRGMASFLNFLKESAIDQKVSHAFLVYVHPKEQMMAIGSPTDWAADEMMNKRVTDMWGKLPVFGPVQIFRRTEFRGKPEKKKRKLNASAPAAPTTADEAVTFSSENCQATAHFPAAPADVPLPPTQDNEMDDSSSSSSSDESQEAI